MCVVTLLLSVEASRVSLQQFTPDDNNAPSDINQDRRVSNSLRRISPAYVWGRFHSTREFRRFNGWYIMQQQLAAGTTTPATSISVGLRYTGV